MFTVMSISPKEPTPKSGELFEKLNQEGAQQLWKTPQRCEVPPTGAPKEEIACPNAKNKRCGRCERQTALRGTFDGFKNGVFPQKVSLFIQFLTECD